jgi:putative ABC transport system permease protein
LDIKNHVIFILFFTPFTITMKGQDRITSNPDSARIISSDINQFWQAFDSLEQQKTTADSLHVIRTHIGQLFNCFAIITIIISCLGLFGLLTFTAESKVKEIGVRKVLGESIPDIVTLLSKDFLVLVLVAAAIAFPVAWYGLNNFLQGYAYRTNIGWWVFALAGIITMLIAMFTVSFKCVQAALGNPVTALKNE